MTSTNHNFSLRMHYLPIQNFASFASGGLMQHESNLTDE
jgi:hypothetical protein